MKRITSLALALALTAALFTGCGCSNVSTHPGGMITEEATRPTVMPTPTATHETSRPTEMTRPTETTHATMPTVTGSEPTDSSSAPSDTPSTSTSPTDETNHGRSRHAAPNR